MLCLWMLAFTAIPPISSSTVLDLGALDGRFNPAGPICSRAQLKLSPASEDTNDAVQPSQSSLPSWKLRWFLKHGGFEKHHSDHAG